MSSPDPYPCPLDCDRERVCMAPLACQAVWLADASDATSLSDRQVPSDAEIVTALRSLAADLDASAASEAVYAALHDLADSIERRS